MSRSERESVVLVPSAGALVLLAGAVLAATISWSGSSDTPCGSAVARNFGFEGSCGIAYRSAFAISSGLGSAAIVLAAVALVGFLAPLLGRRLHTRPALAVALSIWACAAALLVAAAAYLIWSGRTEVDPVLARGWDGAARMAIVEALLVGLALAAAWRWCWPRDRVVTGGSPVRDRW